MTDAGPSTASPGFDGSTDADAQTVTLPAISAAQGHGCVTVNGALKCWGSSYWPLFSATTNDFGTAAQPTTVFASGVTDFSTRAYGVECHILNGALVCTGGAWTNNGVFQSRTLVPSGATNMRLGNFAVCALVNADLRCWATGAFGNPGPLDSWIALSDPTISDYAISPFLVCAIVGGGAVKCSSQYGASSVTTPIAAGATKIVMDANSNGCALVGTNLECWVGYAAVQDPWFYNTDVSRNTSTTPQVVVSDVVDVDMAMNSIVRATCVVKTDTSVACWGDGPAPGAPYYDPWIAMPIRTVVPAGAASVHMMRGKAELMAVGMKDGSVKSTDRSADGGFVDVKLN